MRGYDDEDQDDEAELAGGMALQNFYAPSDPDPYEFCVHCGGSGLSPYAGDGGSCPHCILGRVRRSENNW